MIDTQVVPAVADYAEEVLSKEGFRYVCAVVANCKMLVMELNGQAEDAVDIDALIIAGYLHDISTVAHGFQNHHLKSAAMAVHFLRKLGVPDERISTVERAILAHTAVVSAKEREALPVEGRILYDADKLGRLSGLAIVTSLIDFGAHCHNRTVTGEQLAAMLGHLEERFVELYQSLNTAPAREMARMKFGNTLAFLDGIIEHLSDATPV